MKVTALTLLILQVNSLIDSGNYADISIDDVHIAIQKRGVLSFLNNRAGSDIDLSVHLEAAAFGDFEHYYESELEKIYAAHAGDESKKWGVRNSGLCLILAWTNEIIQAGGDLEI